MQPAVSTIFDQASHKTIGCWLLLHDKSYFNGIPLALRTAEKRMLISTLCFAFHRFEFSDKRIFPIVYVPIQFLSMNEWHESEECHEF